MRSSIFSLLVASCAGLPLTGLTAAAAEPPDLTRVDRRLAKEPRYQAKQPLYGLYVFGPEARTRVWAVLDKSVPDSPRYDVLYFDRNADGDLTAPNERIYGKTDGDDTRFDIGTFKDPVSKQRHTKVQIRHTEGKESMTMFRMKWRDKVAVEGGYASKPGPYTVFATSPAEAPILWPAADGAFSFQFWMRTDPLTIGAAEDVKVFLGHRGHGENTFCAVPDTFLPKAVPVLATLIYKDKEGQEQRARSELRQRC